MRVLVTGSSGYLGSHFCAALATRTAGEKVVLSVSGNPPPATGAAMARKRDRERGRELHRERESERKKSYLTAVE